MSSEDGQHADALPLSAIVGRPVRSQTGETLGRIQNMIARIGAEEYPLITGFVARTGSRDYFVPWAQVRSLNTCGIELSSARVDLRPFQRRESEMLLGRDLRDRRVIDITRKRVVRVNDVLVRCEEGACRLAGVDAGWLALARQLGIHRVMGTLGWNLGTMPLDWSQVEFFARVVPVRLASSHAKTADMHPADIAEVMDSLSLKQGQEILGSLDDETAADTLEEMSPERQADLVHGMDDERAADILEKMDPDDAADLLADLPEDRADDILEAMEPEESEDVRELLRYPEDSAGGIMTTDFIAVPRRFTAGEVLEDLRSREELPETILYIYVTVSGEDMRLVGVAALHDVLLAPPERPLGEMMCTDFISVPVAEDDREVARLMARYDLLAVPVLDEDGRLLGIVTVDDAMEIILPSEWKRRLPRVFR